MVARALLNPSRRERRGIVKTSFDRHKIAHFAKNIVQKLAVLNFLILNYCRILIQRIPNVWDTAQVRII